MNPANRLNEIAINSDDDLKSEGLNHTSSDHSSIVDVNSSAEPHSQILHEEMPGDLRGPQAQIVGFVDAIGNLELSGWVYNPNRTSQQISITINETTTSSFPAIGLRQDVREAGFGDGLCGFKLLLPPFFAKGLYSVRVFESDASFTLTNGLFLLKNGEIKDYDDSWKAVPFRVSAFLDSYYKIRANGDVESIAAKIGAAFQGMQPNVAIAMLYGLVLNRLPEPMGYTARVIASKNCSEWETSALELLTSEEFQTKCSLREVEERLQRLSIPDVLFNLKN